MRVLWSLARQEAAKTNYMAIKTHRHRMQTEKRAFMLLHHGAKCFSGETPTEAGTLFNPRFFENCILARPCK